jgi:replicative DNA helicase
MARAKFCRVNYPFAKDKWVVHKTDHQIIFETILELDKKNKPIDILTVTESSTSLHLYKISYAPGSSL